MYDAEGIGWCMANLRYTTQVDHTYLMYDDVEETDWCMAVSDDTDLMHNYVKIYSLLPVNNGVIQFGQVFGAPSVNLH